MAILKSVVDVNNGNTGWTKSDVMDALETVFANLGWHGGSASTGVPQSLTSPTGATGASETWRTTGGVAVWTSTITHYYNATATGTSAYRLLKSVPSNGYQYWYPSWEWFYMGTAWPGSYGGVYFNTSNAGNNYNWFHIGTGADGKHRWMRTNKSALGSVSIWKTVWASTTPTLTHVLNESSNPGTGGTHYGGNFNNGTQGVIWPSKFYTDPRD